MEASGPLVDPKQLAIQFGIFAASFAVLKTILFKPYLELLHRRKEKSTDLKEKIADARVKSTALKEEYENFLKGERKKTSAWVEEERRKLAEEEKKVIEEARNQVAGKLSTLRKQIDEQVEAARKELTPQVGDYSSRIVTKLVGKKVVVAASSSGSGSKHPEADQSI